MGHSGPILTLSNAAGASLSSPRLLVANASVWAASPLGVAIRHVIYCFQLFIYLLIFPPSYVALWGSKACHRPTGESVSWCLENSLFFKTPFPGWISIPTSFVSPFIFYILSYLLLKAIGCFSGCLMFSASIQKLFCGICPAFKCSFEAFLVVSPSYSSAILGPPLRPSNLIPWPLGNSSKIYACEVSTRTQKFLKSHHCMLQGLKS